MKDLMIHVERVVRPVRASARRKLRMREELLAHLLSIHEEERSRSGEDDAALAAARQRFGDPAEVTRELQASVDVGERIAYVLERWFGMRPAESPACFLFRLTCSLLLLSLVLYVLLVASVLLLGAEEEAIPVGLSLAGRLRLGAALLVIGCLDVFLFGLLYFRMRAALGIQPERKRSWRRAVVCVGLCMLAVLASGMAFTLLGIGSATISLELAYLWLPLTVVLPAGFVVWGLTWGRREVRLMEWITLDISRP